MLEFPVARLRLSRLPIHYRHLVNVYFLGQVDLKQPLLKPPFSDIFPKGSDRIERESEGNNQWRVAFVVWNRMDDRAGITAMP